MCVVVLSGASLQQQVQPLKDYHPKGIGILSADTTFETRAHDLTHRISEGGNYWGVKVYVRKDSPAWLAGLTSDDVAVRINEKYLSGPSADRDFHELLTKADGANKEISLCVCRNSEKVFDMLFIVKVTPKEGFEDFTGRTRTTDAPSTTAKPASNYSAGGIGLRDMQLSRETLMGTPTGGIVVTVLKDSPAWTEGLRDGDEIVQVDDLELEQKKEAEYAIVKLREHLLTAKLDSAVKLIIRRPTAPPDKLFSLTVKKRTGVIDREFPLPK